MNDKETKPATRVRRRKKWVPGGLQWRIALTTFVVSSVALLFNFQFSLMGLWKIYSQSPVSVETIFEQTKNMLVSHFLIIAAATVFLSLWAGFMYFTVCGPLYRFKQFFLGLAEGRWDQRCALRRYDQLQDLKESINQALGTMAQRIEEQRSMLEESRSILEKTASGDSRARELIQKIDDGAAEHARRFGEAPDAERETPEEPETAEEPVGASAEA